jgi:hypothetical protein
VGAKVDKKSQETADAIRKEMDGLTTTIEPVLRKLSQEELRAAKITGRTIVPLLMILDAKTKQMPNGEVEQYIKARLCANGSTQDVLHSDKTSPTPSQITTRLFIANAQSLGLQLFVADYSQAYIQGIWPIGLEKIIGTYNNEHYCIEKPLYGLKQSGKIWRDTIVQIYTTLGFTMDTDDPCIFRRTTATGTTTLLIYVDDVLYYSTNTQSRLKFEHDIRNTGNKLTLMGPARDFAGLTLTRCANGELHLSCKNTIVKMMAKHHAILGAQPVTTPWISETMRDRRDITAAEPLSPKDTQTYQSFVGTFIYAATSTRPEISTAYSRLATKQRTPSQHDLADAIHLAKYLRDTPNHGLVFPWGTKTMHQIIYTDANHGDKRDEKQRARSGALIYMGDCLVAWTSQKQEMAVIGSRDAEWIACHDGIHIGDVCNYMQDAYEQPGAPPRPVPQLHTDNQVLLNQLAKNTIPITQRLAMFRCPIVKAYYDAAKVIFYKIHTSVNPSDLLTKETPHITFCKLAQMMVSNVHIF